MSFIGEAATSAAIQVLFDQLTSSELLQFARRANIYSDLKKWEEILVKIQAVLDDAEEKQMMKNRSVDVWLSDLSKLAYDVEDILEEFATETLRRNLLNDPQASTSKLIPTWFAGLSLRSVKFNVKMASNIKKITDRFEEIVEQKDKLNLIESSERTQRRVQGAIYQKLPETSVNEPHIYGRENDKEAILRLLLNDEGTDHNFSVISIVGMGGLGKTTLAQLAYNDVQVQASFDMKVWATVSDDFDVARITKKILHSVERGTGDQFNDLDEFQVALKEKLSGKKLFIVLDDVWNENYNAWTLLCRPFQETSPGSKILVTTRNQGVSSVVGALRTYQLNKLSNDDCLSVFTRHSLGKEDFSEHQYLEEIGRKIMERCDGLPLAAKTLGGLLRSKVRSKDWEDVLNSKIWNLPEAKVDIIPALRVSYQYLPSHLKRCFAYCSIFPKDYQFDKEEMILLWMSEGFLQTNNKEEHKEDLGDECFQELHSRSFFQQLSGNASLFVMHDLIHDLAQWAAEDICFRIENMSEGEKQWKLPKNLRHLSWVPGKSKYDCVKVDQMKCLRTFLLLMPFGVWDSFDFPYVFLQLGRLRVLSLKKCPISKLPNTIGDLKYLRLLDLSFTYIKILPNSISMLYNLETLKLERCIFLKRLCSDIGNLIQLRHLVISDAPLEAMPFRIGRLTNLRSLPIFVVGKHIGSGLGELKYLTQLRGSLYISGLENVNDPGDVEDACLNGMRDLKELWLEWTYSNDDSNEKEITGQVLDKLRPCEKLESLNILGYGGTQLPAWLGDPSFTSLVNLTFDKCKNCAFLPSVGHLPLLKKLVIMNMAELKILGLEFYGNGYSVPFQSLEELNIWNMQELTDWIPCGFGRNVGAFPQLQRLSIGECSNLLGKLPEHLPSLETLSIDNCKQLSVSVPILPKHCTIRIHRCKEVVLTTIKDCSPLSSMVHLLSSISSYVLLAEWSLKAEKLHAVEYDEPIPSLSIGYRSKGSIRAMPLKLYFPGDYLDLMAEDVEELQQQQLGYRYQYLILKDCKCLVKLEQALQSLSFLRGIWIIKFPNIISFPEAALLSQPKFIFIEECNALQSLPMAWMHSSNTFLQKLYISYCDSLTCIARVHLPPNLKVLEIVCCSNLLTILVEEEVSGSSSSNISRLEYLSVDSCPSLISLWSKGNKLPDTLREVKLSSCSNLVSLASSGDLPENLRYLSIRGCSKLASISESFCDNMNLEELYIEDCETLKNLPSGMNNQVTFQRLTIGNCPGIVSIPEGGFPTSLTSLSICGMEICNSFFEWGLHRLTSLQVLKIRGGCPDVVCFPQEVTGLILPSSLTALHIEDFPNLECLSSVAQNLTCLKVLNFFNCPKLHYVPKSGLPASLKALGVIDCPLLKARIMARQLSLVEMSLEP